MWLHQCTSWKVWTDLQADPRRLQGGESNMFYHFINDSPLGVARTTMSFSIVTARDLCRLWGGLSLCCGQTRGAVALLALLRCDYWVQNVLSQRPSVTSTCDRWSHKRSFAFKNMPVTADFCSFFRRQYCFGSHSGCYVPLDIVCSGEMSLILFEHLITGE